MVEIRRNMALALGVVALVCAIAFAGQAMAAGSVAPQLRWPEGRAVHAGHVRLRVYIPDPGLLIRHNVFLVIATKRRIKDGLLELGEPCGFRCTDTLMKRHSTHLWTYYDHYLFPGLWQDTPGTYYWQAYYYPNTGVLGVVASRVGRFRIVG